MRNRQIQKHVLRLPGEVKVNYLWVIPPKVANYQGK